MRCHITSCGLNKYEMCKMGEGNSPVTYAVAMTTFEKCTEPDIKQSMTTILQRAAYEDFSALQLQDPTIGDGIDFDDPWGLVNYMTSNNPDLMINMDMQADWNHTFERN